MFTSPMFALRTLFLLLCTTRLCLAYELEPIRPKSYDHGIAGRRLAKRDFTTLDLKSVETFLWGAEGLLTFLPSPMH